MAKFFFKKCGDCCKIVESVTTSKQIKCKIFVKSLPFYTVSEDNYFSWLLKLSQADVTNLMT